MDNTREVQTLSCIFEPVSLHHHSNTFILLGTQSQGTQLLGTQLLCTQSQGTQSLGTQLIGTQSLGTQLPEHWGARHSVTTPPQVFTLIPTPSNIHCSSYNHSSFCILQLSYLQYGSESCNEETFLFHLIIY